jgi:catechol O-methyltransferase
MRSFLGHLFKNAFLLALSLFFLPIDSAVTIATSILPKLNIVSKNEQPPTNGPRKTVLITGMSMSKGLVLARLFHRAGHRVVGADIHPLAMGRVSSSLDKFYVLPRVSSSSDDASSEEEMEDEDDPYVLRLLGIVKKEDVDLWISVSDVNAAMRDAVARDVIEAHTKAKAVQLGPRDVRTLHEKDAFMEHTRGLGLPVPDSDVVSSKAAVIDFLNKRGGLRLKEGGRQYVLKPIGVDDVARNDRVLLPLATEQETLRRLDGVHAFRAASTTSPDKSFAEAAAYPERPAFMMQEFIHGREFCTHALVVKGRVRAFTACPSSGLLMHYTAMPEDTPLCGAMLAFTRIMAGAGGEEWTGHVSFDFIVQARHHHGESSSSSSVGKEKAGEDEEELGKIYPIECNPRVHTAIVLFNDTPRLVDEYLSVLDDEQHASNDEPVFPATTNTQYYWIGQDLIERVAHPLYLHFFSRRVTHAQLWESVRSFAQHVAYWKEGTFETWDPWPWWWLYHVYWPSRFVTFMLKGEGWDAINVSTGKAFKAK